MKIIVFVFSKININLFVGSITITAPSVENVQRAVEHIYPLVEEFQKPKSVQDIKEPIPKTKQENNTK